MYFIVVVLEGLQLLGRIISYVKALKFNNYSNTKFIGLNNLFIIACYLNLKCKINDNIYILSILNHSKDNFVQIYQKKKKFLFFLKSLSDIKNIDLDLYRKLFKNFKFIYSKCSFCIFRCKS